MLSGTSVSSRLPGVGLSEPSPSPGTERGRGLRGGAQGSRYPLTRKDPSDDLRHVDVSGEHPAETDHQYD